MYVNIYPFFHYQHRYFHTKLKIGTVCRSALCYNNYIVKCNIFTNYFTIVVLLKQLNLDISISREIIIFWLICNNALSEVYLS